MAASRSILQNELESLQAENVLPNSVSQSGQLNTNQRNSTDQQKQLPLPPPPARISTKELLTETASNPAYTDDQILEAVLEEISVQSDELLLGEEMWRRRALEKKLSENCLTPIGRSHRVGATFPSVAQAKAWSVEKEFWNSSIPRQQRIWKYSDPEGNAGEFWSPITKRFGPRQEKKMEELNKESQTGKRLSQNQQCRRYSRQVRWEQKVIAEYDEKAKRMMLGNEKYETSERLKDRELKRTLNRYKFYGKSVTDNLRDIENDTRRIDEISMKGIFQRFQVEQMERLVSGYNNLKWIYDMNPELVDNLATQHFSSAPGKRWMNLNKGEVKQVLMLLQMGRGNPDFCPSTYLIMPQEDRRPSLPHQDTVMPRPSLHYTSSVRIMPGPGPTQGPALAPVMMAPNPPPPVMIMNPPPQTTPRKSVEGPLRASKQMPVHIPGPNSLKHNIVIRAYSKEMDGPPLTKGSLRKSKDGTKVDGEEDDEEEEEEEEEIGLTIESFVPSYRS